MTELGHSLMSDQPEVEVREISQNITNLPSPVSVTDFYLRAILAELRQLNRSIKAAAQAQKAIAKKGK